jgi:hypothetical protein
MFSLTERVLAEQLSKIALTERSDDNGSQKQQQQQHQQQLSNRFTSSPIHYHQLSRTVRSEENNHEHQSTASYVTLSPSCEASFNRQYCEAQEMFNSIKLETVKVKFSKDMQDCELLVMREGDSFYSKLVKRG